MATLSPKEEIIILKEQLQKGKELPTTTSAGFWFLSSSFSFGKEDQENLSKTFEKTKALYLEAFGEQIVEPEASRCQDHACHVESSCACRVESACKNH